MWNQKSARSRIQRVLNYNPHVLFSRESYKYTTPYSHIHALLRTDDIFPYGSGKVDVVLYLPDGDKTRSFNTFGRAEAYVYNQLALAINRERANRRFQNMTVY